MLEIHATRTELIALILLEKSSFQMVPGAGIEHGYSHGVYAILASMA